MEKLASQKSQNGFTTGWQIYPLNQSYHDVARVDLVRTQKLLECDINRIAGGDTNIKVLLVDYFAEGHRPLFRKTLIESEEHLKKVVSDRPEYGDDQKVIAQHVFYSIDPPFSFAQLKISEDMLRKLLTALVVFPGFLDVLHLYGRKIGELNEDYAVYRQHISPGLCSGDKLSDIESFEICYNFRHVEQRIGNAHNVGVIWTTRKIGIYAKYEPKKKKTTWITLQASPDIQRRLDEVFESDSKRMQPRRHDLDIHLMIMMTANHNWLHHINDLDREFQDMDTKAYMWRPKPGNPVANEHRDSELELEDTQRIQRFRVKLLTVLHALDVNVANIESLRRGVAKFRKCGSDLYVSEAELERYDEALEDLRIQTVQHRIRVENLHKRAKSLFELIITIIPYIFARRENSLMFRLTEKTTQYAKSMKVITVVCMLYLPPSLVAGVFGMDFFHGAMKGVMILWVVISTLGLMLLTLGVWVLWDRFNLAKAGDEENLPPEAIPGVVISC